MEIIISNQTDAPIYEQVYSQIKNSILNGQLKENEMLPSVRNLAKDLKISVITTRRAYEELERDGYIYTSIGKGSFVSSLNHELIKENTLHDIEKHILKVKELSNSISLSEEELLEVIKSMLEGE